VNRVTTSPATAPLGPGSLLWRYAGDWRSMLPGISAGLLQLMDPALGAGVTEHSAFFSEPFERVYRSVPQIWATIFEPEDGGRGRAIRDIHRSIKGHDDHGRRYHALDPDTFWWAHATFTWDIFRSIDVFHPGRLSRSHREQLYAETVTWYSRYEMSMRPVPPTYDDFVTEFRRITRDVLELTPAAARAVELARTGSVSLPSGSLPFIGALAGPLLTPGARNLAFGCLPRAVRERFAIPWSAADQVAFNAFAAAVRNGFRIVPYPVNAWTFQVAQRAIGARTRRNRIRPAA